MEMNFSFYQQKEKELIPETPQDRVVAGYIQALAKEDCTEALHYDDRDFVHLHLSNERCSAISWYPYLDNATVLEIGAEFGAMTGEICDRAKYVVVTESSLFRAQALQKRYHDRKNLKVYVGNIEAIQFEKQFDLIIIFGMVEKLAGPQADESLCVQRLKELKKYLKPDGRFLVAEDNIYALEGCRSDKSALRVTGKRKGLHRAQIKRIMQEVGVKYLQFFYPLPEYKKVQKMYTDREQPKALEWAQLAGRKDTDRQRILADAEVMQPLLDNHLFAHYAPAFVVEAAINDILVPLEEISVLRESKSEGNGIKEYYFQKGLEAAVCKVDEDHAVIRQVLEVELDLLHKLQEVCEAFHLHFYPIYGTLLGAVRHAGIIPGDDDIDVLMPREDYDKLTDLTEKFDGEYFLQTPVNDNCFYGGYLKLRNRKTTSIDPQNWWVDCCEGISIDIFPMDRSYINKGKEAWKLKKIRHWQRLLYAKTYGYYPRFKDMGLLMWKTYKYIGKLFTRAQMVEQLNAALREGDSSDKVGIYTHYLEKVRQVYYERKAFEKTILFPFETIMLPLPAGWDQILRVRYGDNYMKIPSWSESKMRHGFYNPDVPYDVYQKRFRLFRPMPDQDTEIVLFGDGLLWDSYFLQYGERYQPKAIVSFSVWDKEEIRSIKVQTMEHFLGNSKGKIYPVLCCIDIRDGEKRLQEAGIMDYHIFLPVRKWMLYANYTFILSQNI